MPIENIIFDLGNVLVPLRWDRAYRLMRPLLQGKALRLLDQDRSAFNELFMGPTIELETGRIDFPRFHDCMRAQLDWDVDIATFEKVWNSIFDLDKDIVALGHTLAERYGTWLASNTSQTHYEFVLAEFPDIRFYRNAALSYQLGHMKPDAEYYSSALTLFGIQAESAVFIDDLPANVQAAVAAGMAGIQYTGYTALVPALHSLGVETG